jgi:hypothetical protein
MIIGVAKTTEAMQTPKAIRKHVVFQNRMCERIAHRSRSCATSAWELSTNWKSVGAAVRETRKLVRPRRG